MAIKTFYQNKKIFLAGAIPILSLFLYSDSASAQATYNALVTIPGIPNGASVQVYLSGLYTFLISVVGIVAMGAIVIGGARYLTSAGNPSAIEDAKHTINSAIIGLLLAITSWVIIREINPDITVLKNPAMPWSAAGYSPGDSGPCCALPGGIGTKEAFCSCADGTEQSYDKISTALTLSLSPVNPPPSAPAGNITFSGKLTDASGNGLASKTIEIRTVNDSLNAWDTFTLTTDASGSFSDTQVANCSATVTVQAVFDKTAADPAYLPSTSAPTTLTYGGAPACINTDYNNLPASPPPTIILPTDFCQWMCSDSAVPLDKMIHCAGWEYLKIKMIGNTTSSGDYYTLNSSTQLEEFWLTNKGSDYGLLDFDITAQNYVNGPDTYECAILLEDTNTGLALLPFIYGFYIYWVKEGVEINSNGSSLRADIESSAKQKGIINPFYGGCDITGLSPYFGVLGADCCGNDACIEKTFKAHYIVNPPITDRCGDCTFSTSNSQFRPAYDIICAKDGSGRIVWRKK